jgi:UPF0716 protein FxsA
MPMRLLPLRLLLLLLVAIPVADLVLLGRIAAEIGLGPTLLTVFASGWLGLAIVRREGAALLAGDESIAVWRVLGIVAGGLFVLPGFVTDVLGLALLAPPVRGRVAPWVAERLTVRTLGGFDVPPASEPRIKVGDTRPQAPSRPRSTPFSTPFD